MGEPDETPLGGGWVTEGVVRVGETVRRPPGRRAGFVHELLLFLEEIGFPASPRFLGLDEKGREVLTFRDGEVPSDTRSRVFEDGELESAAVLLRQFHDATAGSALAGQAEVVCHNDFGPWNLVWRANRPVGIIDFDNAAPGERLEDLAYAVWKHLNLGLIDLALQEQGRRLRVMTSAYGLDPSTDVAGAILAAQERMRKLVHAAPAGRARDEALEQNAREQNWTRSNAAVLRLV